MFLFCLSSVSCSLACSFQSRLRQVRRKCLPTRCSRCGMSSPLISKTFGRRKTKNVTGTVRIGVKYTLQSFHVCWVYPIQWKPLFLWGLLYNVCSDLLQTYHRMTVHVKMTCLLHYYIPLCMNTMNILFHIHLQAHYLDKPIEVICQLNV